MNQKHFWSLIISVLYSCVITIDMEYFTEWRGREMLSPLPLINCLLPKVASQKETACLGGARQQPRQKKTETDRGYKRWCRISQHSICTNEAHSCHTTKLTSDLSLNVISQLSLSCQDQQMLCLHRMTVYCCRFHLFMEVFQLFYHNSPKIQVGFQQTLTGGLCATR